MGLTLSRKFPRTNSFLEKLCRTDNEFPCFPFKRRTIGKHRENVHGINSLSDYKREREKKSNVRSSWISRNFDSWIYSRTLEYQILRYAAVFGSANSKMIEGWRYQIVGLSVCWIAKWDRNYYVLLTRNVIPKHVHPCNRRIVVQQMRQIKINTHSRLFSQIPNVIGQIYSRDESSPKRANITPK